MNLENINLTEELILKAGECKTSEELMALARENGVEITPEQLPELMAEVAKKCSGELSDDALEAASAVGGKASYTDKNGRKYKVVISMHWCNNYRCKGCGCVTHYDNNEKHIGNCKYGGFHCGNCKHIVQKNGLWLCPIL